MTMYDLDSLARLANAIYRQSLPAAALNETAVKPGLPEQLIPAPAKPSKASSPDPPAEPDLRPEPSYYFLTRNPIKKSADPNNLTATSGRDVNAIRQDFPILKQKINGKPLIWLDNAATTQKPLPVIEAISGFYRESNSNVHRGIHTLASRATAGYEEAREKVRRLINAAAPEEIIFLRGTTEAINLVAASYGRNRIHSGDAIILTAMEHHSNIVPWQMLRETTGVQLRITPITARGEVNLSEYERLLSRSTRLVALTQVSNVLGTINPVRTMIEMAHYYGARVLIDGAQAIPHLNVDVQSLDADFYTFSGHKAYGPTGIGVLYGKKELLEEMPPWQGGGSMIQEVSFEKTTYNSLPYKFEAGTGNIAAAVGLGAAVDYLQKIGLAWIGQHEQELTTYVRTLLGKIPGLQLFGTAPLKAGVISFTLEGISQEDLARRLDREGIAVRVGHHCAQPLMKHYGIKGMVRVSLGMYNTREEMEQLAEAIAKIVKQLR
ncbi:MAG TPA: cysteine desulfurase [Bacillota bacterium]